MTRTACALMICLLSGPALYAWGEKGHLLVNEAATWTTPNEMPPFFHRAYPQLVYLGYDPDRWRGAGESLEEFNGPNHFLDYEYVAHLKLPRTRYGFVELLVTSKTLDRFGIKNSTSGFLPWQIAELSEQLAVQWKLWRAAGPGVERDQIEQNIIQLSGVLGHFIADAANPHHVTIDYNGWVESNPENYPIDCDTHNRFETQFVSRAMKRSDIVSSVRPVELQSNYFLAALEFIKGSNALVDDLYRIDRDGGFVPYSGTDDARAFTISRMAAGAAMLRDFWWSTWKNSEPKPKSEKPR